MRMTTYGCWLSPLTRFVAPHCGGPSPEAAGMIFDCFLSETTARCLQSNAELLTPAHRFFYGVEEAMSNLPGKERSPPR